MMWDQGACFVELRSDRDWSLRGSVSESETRTPKADSQTRTSVSAF
jgi:hypothetical protein